MPPLSLGIGIGLPDVGPSVLIAPANTVAPSISGSQVAGSVLTATTGTWTGTPTPTKSYQWTRDGSNISSATSSTYATVVADVGHAIGCTVTATNVVGSASQASSNTITATGAIVSWDFTTQPVGGGTASPLVYARASADTAEDRVGGTAVTGLANNTPSICKSAAGNKGLGLWPTRTNLLPVSANIWDASFTTSSGATNPGVSITAPDGTANGAAEIQDDNAGAIYERHRANTTTSGKPYTNSAWSKWISGDGAAVGDGNGHNTHFGTSGAWERQAAVNPSAATSMQHVIYPGSGPSFTNASLGLVAAWGMMIEQGAYETPLIVTTGASATRAGPNLTTPAATTVTSSGKVSLYIELELPSTFANADSAMRVWSDPNDATTYVELATTGTLTVSVGGSTNTCSISGSAAGSVLRLWVKAGGAAATVVEYKIGAGSVTTPTITGSALGAVAPSGVLEVACSGTAKQLAGIHLRGGFLVDGVNPSAQWASAAGF